MTRCGFMRFVMVLRISKYTSSVRGEAQNRGLAKNTSQFLVMFAMSNLWMVRKRILQGLQA